MAEKRIAIMGEALVDIVPDKGAKSAVPGGSGLNTALALARLSAPVSYLGSLSLDDEGMHLASLMAREGIDLAASCRSQRPCPRVHVSTDAHGAPHYDLQLDGSALEDVPVHWSLPEDLVHFHATSFACTIGAAGDAALVSLREAHKRASTSFDPNIRASILPGTAQTQRLIALRIEQADLVKVSEEDLDLLGGASILNDWRMLGPSLFIVTHGAKGATALFEHGEISVPGVPVVVQDTVGAGDTFMGACLAAMHADDALGSGKNTRDAHKIERWLAFAARAAALCCTRAGADPPRRAEMRARQ